MDADNASQNTPQGDKPKSSAAKWSRLTIIIVVVATLFALALFYVRSSPFFTPDAPGVTLTDIHSIDDLEARFNEAQGNTRLILFVSPT